jgi:hypothetical protein
MEERKRARACPAHLAGLGLDLDVVGHDEFGLEFAAPLERALDASLAVVELPLGGAHVARDGVGPVKPPELPLRVRVVCGQAKCLGVLTRVR